MKDQDSLDLLESSEWVISLSAGAKWLAMSCSIGASLVVAAWMSAREVAATAALSAASLRQSLLSMALLALSVIAGLVSLLSAADLSYKSVLAAVRREALAAARWTRLEAGMVMNDTVQALEKRMGICVHGQLTCVSSEELRVGGMVVVKQRAEESKSGAGGSGRSMLAE
jgi:hypothetical protein